MTRELPILFSPQMVRQLPPRGPKSQTRRTRGLGEINESPDEWTVESTDAEAATLLNRVTGELRTIRCPYGPAGTRLRVRERWAVCEVAGQGIGNQFVIFEDEWVDRGEGNEPNPTVLRPCCGYRWGNHPSIHMPREFCRSTFINTGWRLERVMQISEEDCLREGLRYDPTRDPYARAQVACRWISEMDPSKSWNSGVGAYRELWDHLNGKKLPWSRNPWCWVIGFKPEGGAK